MTLNPHGSKKSRIAAELLGTPALYLAVAAQITDALLSMLEYRVERRAYKSADDVHRLACKFVAEHLVALVKLGGVEQVVKAQAENLAERLGRLVVAVAEAESEVRR